MNPNNNTSKYLPHFTPTSTEFEERLTTKSKSTNNRPFSGRTIKIKNSYSLSNQLWEIIYRCTGNTKAAKALFQNHSKQYLIKKLVSLFSGDQLPPQQRLVLETHLENSITFQRKVKKIETITPEDIRTIRTEIQSNYSSTEDSAQHQPQATSSPLPIIKPHCEPNLPPTDQIGELNYIIRFHLALGQIDKAIPYYEQQLIITLKQYPDDKWRHNDMLNKLTNLYQQTNNIPKVIEYTERTSPNPKQFIESLETLAQNCLSTNNSSGAIQCYEHILTLPQTPLDKQIETLNNLKYIYFDDSNYIQNAPQLINCFERIANLPGVSLDDKIYALSNIGCIYHGTQRQTIAITYYERIVALPGIEKEDQFRALLALAQLHDETDNLDKQIESYERVFALSGIPIHCQYVCLLAELYRKKGTPDKAIQFYEHQLNHIDQSKDNPYAIDPITILTQLVAIHEESNNIPAQIKYLNLLTTQEELSKHSLRKALQKLHDIYLKTNETTLLISTLTQLAETGEPHHYEEILKLPDLTPTQQFDALIALAKLYEKSKNIQNQIACHEQTLTLSILTSKNRIITLTTLIRLYLDANDFPKAKECEFEILKLNPTLNIEILLIFLNHPTGLHASVKALINSSNEKNKILDLLASYYWLWSDIKGKPQKLTNQQWTTLFTGPDTPGELERLALQPSFTTSGLNRDLFFNDPTMPEWNILVQRTSTITDNNWEIIESDLLKIFDTIHSPDKDQRKYLSKFLSQCMESKGAQKSVGKQFLRKRITACIDFLTNLLASKPEDPSTIKFLQNSLATMIIGGTACPDRTVVFLTSLETNIKLFINPNFLPNIIAHKYKFEAITQTLVPEINDPIEVDSKGIPIIKENENLETLFYYTRKLNTPLGLGLDNSTQILYEYLAKTVPLELTIEPLSAAFTQEKLLHFTIKEPCFISKFETTKDTAIPPEKQQEYIDAINDHSDAIGTPEENDKNIRISQIQNEMKQLEKIYFLNEAKKMYIQSGHIYNY